MTDGRIVLVACASKAEATRISRELVSSRLAACANVLDAPLTSIYRWKGKVQSAREFLLVIKTTARRFRALAAAVERLHSYDTPEIISLPIAEGAARYLAWLTESVKPPAGTKRPERKKW
jgi:periplasmic divalent cation tolerance protein